MAYQYKLVNQPTAVKKAQKAVDSAQKAMKKADSKYHKTLKEVKELNKAPKKESAAAKQKRLNKLNAAEKRKKADKTNYERKKARHSKAKSKLDKLKQEKKDAQKISSQLEEHDSEWNNEGKCAIYPTNTSKDGANIIYISPSDAESESNSNNVTSWPVDKGTPRSSYARMTSRGISVEGLLTGKNGDNAHDKYTTLRKWSENHIELTYRGDIYYTHLIITALNRDFTDLEDNLHVSITFSYVQAASISTKGKKSKHKKKSKSSKTKAGNRHKKYTAITIKSGDTLWALSKKYGKSVKWLAKVNKIKNPNIIISGKKIRVK